jgi:GMC oxidoreductase/NAD(P)-binding Rossmann-like domain
MQFDLELLTDNAPFASETCIVGGGIAGLVLARKLASRGIRVHILEAGGLTLEPRSQELYDVEREGRPHNGATEGRFRVFGGNSTRWGAELLTYSPDIFDPPKGIPSAAWPVTSVELERYYTEVQETMHITQPMPQARFPLSSLQENSEDAADIVFRYSKWAPFSKRNLAKTVGREFTDSPLISVFLHANATSIEVCNTTGRVLSINAKSYSGKIHRFHAKQFVICAGTIESCRILLVSKPSLEPVMGDSALNLGRFFHDHIGVAAASMTGTSRRQFIDLFTPSIADGILHTPKFEASVSLRRKQQLLPVMAFFIISESEMSGTAAVRAFLQRIQNGDGLKPIVKAGLTLPRHSLDVAHVLWSTRVRKRRPISSHSSITLQIDSEQSHSGGSRIRLSDRCDVLGMPRAIVDWRISEEEKRNVQLFARVMERFLNRAGITKIPWNPELWLPDDSWLKLTRDTNHAMGGTCMGTDPASSVVDRNLKVHGVSNLFVASCSVYPTGGCANPTFTLMALALRLGDHLADSLKASEREILSPVVAPKEAIAQPIQP